MKKNVNNTDKIVRIALGIIIAAAGFYFKSWWGLVALVPFGTALAGWCPLYSILVISTCRTTAHAK